MSGYKLEPKLKLNFYIDQNVWLLNMTFASALATQLLTQVDGLGSQVLFAVSCFLIGVCSAGHASTTVGLLPLGRSFVCMLGKKGWGGGGGGAGPKGNRLCSWHMPGPVEGEGCFVRGLSPCMCCHSACCPLDQHKLLYMYIWEFRE
jgi:hypothetical protein